MLKFGNSEETTGAMLILTCWLPELAKRFEAGVQAMGFEVVEKTVERYEDGIVNPVLTLRRADGNWTIKLGLRNALEEFLFLDRDEEPKRFDTRLLDDVYAEKKLTNIVEGRLALAQTFTECRSAGEVQKRMETLAPRFEHMRIWKFDE
ncbi:MAG: hypothetical protein E3J72_00975 [Planctomycetota bacterium]|nr:MAG: hypothetical protein E3J72_00975 [Planctomycetota bacterium]